MHKRVSHPVTIIVPASLIERKHPLVISNAQSMKIPFQKMRCARSFAKAQALRKYYHVPFT
jgi:hypothetical protein